MWGVVSREPKKPREPGEEKGLRKNVFVQSVMPAFPEPIRGK